MELLQLRYFLVAAQYQHMTKAAEHLQIAQPALSQAIHRLEAELGVPLFERKNRSIELNDEGKFLQKRLIPKQLRPAAGGTAKRKGSCHPHCTSSSPFCLCPDHQPDHCLQKPPPGCKFPAVPDTRTGRRF